MDCKLVLLGMFVVSLFVIHTHHTQEWIYVDFSQKFISLNIKFPPSDL